MQRRMNLWPVAGIGLAGGLAAMAFGALAGGELGPLIVGYGLLLALASIYLILGLAIRDRVWRRSSVVRAPRATLADPIKRRQPI